MVQHVYIRCITLDGGFVSSNSYRAEPSGNSYLFHRGLGTPFENREDAEYFLKGDGYRKVSDSNSTKVVTDVKKALAEVAKELPAEVKPKEEVKAVEPEVKEETQKELVEKHTKTEIKNMSKREQITLIRELDPNASIPGMESGRVDLILKLEKGG